MGCDIHQQPLGTALGACCYMESTACVCRVEVHVCSQRFCCQPEVAPGNALAYIVSFCELSMFRTEVLPVQRCKFAVALVSYTKHTVCLKPYIVHDAM